MDVLNWHRHIHHAMFSFECEIDRYFHVAVKNKTVLRSPKTVVKIKCKNLDGDVWAQIFFAVKTEEDYHDFEHFLNSMKDFIQHIHLGAFGMVFDSDTDSA